MAYIQHQLLGKRRFRLLLLWLVTLTIGLGLTLTLVERNAPGTRIHNFGDGLWWSVVTLTTVGYGDIVPVTALGRVIAGIQVLAGTAMYLTTFVVVGSTISESQERFQWRRANERLEEIEKQLSAIRKSQEFLVANHPQTKKK